MDIKGNFTEQIRAIARASGREKDVVELGTGPQARKVNLFAGASAQRMYDLLQQFMLCCAASDDHNRAFYLRGLRCVVDALVMLRMMSERGGLPMHLCVLERLMNDEQYARECFLRFCSSIRDEDDPEAHDLVKRIKGDQFHFISEGVPRGMHSTWQEQVGFRLGVIRTALQLLRQTRNLEAQFFAYGKSAPDIAREVYRHRRIVVLRLAPDCGELGAVLARTHDSEAVEAMLNNFNVRTFFYSDDPLTQRLADVHDQTPLVTYRRGEGLLVRIDAATGRRVYGRVSVQAMHDTLKAIQAAHGGQSCPAALSCRLPFRRQMVRKAQRERELEEAYLLPTPQRRMSSTCPKPRAADSEAARKFSGPTLRHLPFGPDEE